MRLTDTHTHLHFDQYQIDLAEVVRRAIDENVYRILTLGIDLDSGREAAKIANNYEHVFAAVGIHPTEIYQSGPQDIDEILILAKNEEKIMAIGEIGLDLHWKEVSLKDQLPVLEKMIEIPTLEMMRKIKKALDPNNVLNPDKIISLSPKCEGKLELG